MQLTDLVDDLLQNMSKQQLRSSKLGFSPTYRRGGFLKHNCWWLKRDVTSAYIRYIPKMPYIPKCWQFSSAQIVPKKKKKKDFQTPEFPPSISIPLFYFLFIVISTPKKKTSTVSPNHHLGLPSPANGTGIPCPLKSLGTGKASALMAGLSMDNDTIGPGDSGVHFHRKVGVSSQWPAFGCFKMTISGLKWPVFGWSKGHLEEAGRWFFFMKILSTGAKGWSSLKIKSYFLPRFDVSGAFPLPKGLPFAATARYYLLKIQNYHRRLTVVFSNQSLIAGIH